MTLNPPHATEAEQQLLGAVMVDNDRFHRVGSILREDHFFEPIHARIWSAIRQRLDRDLLADAITLADDLQGDPGLKELGGGKYLVRLMGASVSGSLLGDYAAVIIATHDRRTLVEALDSAKSRALDGGLDGAGDAVADLETFLHRRADLSTAPRSMSLLRAQINSVEQINEIYQGGAIGVPSGIAALDEVLTLAPKRYTILAGATSMGKTALGLSIAKAAASAGYGVGYVSREMPETDLANRINSMKSLVPYKAYDRPMSEASFRRVVEAAKSLEDLPIEIFSDRVNDVPAIVSECKKLRAKWRLNDNFHGLKLLVVDYIQLIKGRGESAFVRLSEVANDLKSVAKSLDVHVLALAQIDRKIIEREDTRPKLSDLRGSGDLENAPDNVIFVHRPEYYLKRSTPPKAPDDRADWEADLVKWKDKAEIIIGKARMGEITSVTVGCDMGTNRFFDLPDHDSEGWNF